MVGMSYLVAVCGNSLTTVILGHIPTVLHRRNKVTIDNIRRWLGALRIIEISLGLLIGVSWSLPKGFQLKYILFIRTKLVINVACRSSLIGPNFEHFGHNGA